MNRTNSLVICRDNYKTKEDFENAIRDAVMLLLDAEYIMTVKYDEKGFGIVAIEYQYDNEEYGTPLPYWLSPEEFESVVWDDERDTNKE